MDFIDLVIEFAQQSKYPILFLIYLIEGPVAGFISAFVASTGGLNIYIVFLLFITAEIAADIFFYYLGRGISDSRLDKWLSKYEERGILKILKETFNKNPTKALLFTKFTSLIAVPSLILIGKYKSLSAGKFFLYTTIICIIKDITILLMGYGLGITLGNFLVMYDTYKIVGIILSVIAIAYIVFKAYQTKFEGYYLKVLKRIK